MRYYVPFLSHQIKFEHGLGSALNNFVEIKATSIIMILDLEEGLRNLNIYGDSLLVIKWLKGTRRWACIDLFGNL